MSMLVYLIAGARPNFMKISPIYLESLKHKEIECKIVHTGQHYDYEMSQSFFDDLEIPEPSFYLNAGSGTHAVQTAKIMEGFEQLCLRKPPDLIIVVGDVNSTLACSIVAKKLLIDVAHVEAGLRSFDHSMPEEINRIVTDSISDLFFVTEESGIENLKKEGKQDDQIFFVGNVMIDNLYHQLKKIDDGFHKKVKHLSKYSEIGDYIFLTLHRPSNVDKKAQFEAIISAINQISDAYPIIFPVHPRTKMKIEEFNVKFPERVHLLPPLRFRESLFIWKEAVLVMTDSGGLQEETTALGIPCMTLRENTERPITLEKGTNVLAGTTKDSILSSFNDCIHMRRIENKPVPDKWDGRAAQRIWEIIKTDRNRNNPKKLNSYINKIA